MPDSIFDFASHKGGSKPKPKEKPLPTPGKASEPPKSMEELEETYSKVLKQRDDIDSQLGAVFNRTGVDLKTVKRILDNPMTYEGVNAKNFLEQREKYRNDIWLKTGQEDKEKILSSQNEQEESRQKAKGIGARKKNWTFIR